MAGGYGVRNGKKTRKFLRMWSDLEYSQPKGFHSADNGAIHVALMKWFKGTNNRKANQCLKDYQALKDDVLNLDSYYKFVNCARTVLGMGQWSKNAYEDADDATLKEFRSNGGVEMSNHETLVKILSRFKGFMVDYTAAKESSSAVFWHGVKNGDDVHKHWKVQKNNTVFPSCISIVHQDLIHRNNSINSINSIINANQMLNGSNTSENLENIENNSNPGKQ